MRGWTSWSRFDDRIAAANALKSLDVQHGSVIRARKYGMYAPEEVVQHLRFLLLLLALLQRLLLPWLHCCPGLQQIFSAEALHSASG